MNFLSLFFEKTFSVSYIGQLRFVECIETHRNLIKDAKTVSCTLDGHIREIFNRRYTATHSVFDLDETSILLYIKKIDFIKSFRLLQDSDYADFPNKDSVEFFPCNYFFTLAQSLYDSDDSDYTLYITTDIIFSSNSFDFKTIISKIQHTSEPIVYAKDFVQQDTRLLVTRIIILNRSAKELIKNNWKTALDTYLKENHEFKLRNEYATIRLFELCGIKTIKNFNFHQETIRFRSNMDFNNLDTTTLLEQQSQFSENKRQFIIECRNGKHKNQ
jgi:hypothetical protein